MSANPVVDTRSRPQAPLPAKLVFAFAFLLLYVPLASLVALSFLAPEAGPGSPLAFSTEWYSRVFRNETLVRALSLSLWVALCTTVGSTVLGTLAALALERAKFPGKAALDTLMHVPIIMPEIVLGLSMLIWFVMLKLTLGTVSIILAHVTFSMSYVTITVRSRLHGFDRLLEEAARDLGASPWQTFRRVTFPLILPGVLSGALMAFTLSFDDFLITFFTAGVGSDTLPLKLYSMIKFGVSPEVNALSTLMLAVTTFLVLLFFKRR